MDRRARHDDFHALLHDAYVSFHALRKPPGATRDRWDAEVERARQAALGGAVDEPMAVLARARDFGRDRATVLRARMTAMLGEWRQALTDLVWHVPVDSDVLRGPLFTTELLPLLVRHDRLATGYELRTLQRLTEQGQAEAIAAYEARAAEPGFRPTFGGGPGFDAAARAVADRLAADPAFSVPAEPEPTAGPLVVTVYANGPAPEPPADPGRLRAERAAVDAEAWRELRAALRLWRPVCADRIAPISLFADPVLAELITPDRGREILATARGGTV
ncbi:MAG TPA: hypothetical protein VGN37_27495 [Actinocatenispora sp.]